MISPFLFTEESVAFTTREFAASEGLSVSSASHHLARLKRDNLITQVTRGIWANVNHPYFSPYNCIAKLLGPEQGCLSFLSALHIHGIISQIPTNIFVATTGRGRQVKTPIGIFELIQMKPELFRVGVNWSDSRIPYLIASPEKALFDTLYIASRKGKRFAHLPEVDLNLELFNQSEFKKITNSNLIPSRLKALIKTKSQSLTYQAHAY